MPNTKQFNLPYLQPSQAQKHVTVNESLTLLDALANLQLVSIDLGEPPANPNDGDVYFVPQGATSDWVAFTNKIAIFSNGDWLYASPQTGWSAWIIDQAVRATYQQGQWSIDGNTQSAGLAQTSLNIIEFDHQLTTGANSTTAALIPSHSVVHGVTARVIADMSAGTLTSWDLGVAGSTNRYGSGYSLGQNSYVKALTGQPQVYYQDTPLVLTANGGDFDGGTIRLAVHCLEITPPATV